MMESETRPQSEVFVRYLDGESLPQQQDPRSDPPSRIDQTNPFPQDMNEINSGGAPSELRLEEVKSNPRSDRDTQVRVYS